MTEHLPKSEGWRMKCWLSCKNIKKENNRRYHIIVSIALFLELGQRKLNDMGYGLSRIRPITFDDDAFQTTNNRAKDRAPTSTPRKKRNEANDIPTTEMSQQDGNTKSHNTNLLISNTSSNEPVSRFVPSQPNSTGSSSQGTDSSNTTTVHYEKLNGGHQGKCVSIQTSPKNTVSTGTAFATQTANQKALQVEGTQTTPPSSPRKPTSTGETQTSPSKDEPHRQLGQDQPDHSQEHQPTGATTSQGKKTKKSTTEALPHPVPSTGPPVGPRNDFPSRNLGTGRPTIQCTACSANIHTGEGNTHMTIIVQHVKITTMLHTCVGLEDKPPTTKVNRARGVHRHASTVEAWNTAHPTAEGDLGTIRNNHTVHPNP